MILCYSSFIFESFYILKINFFMKDKLIIYIQQGYLLHQLLKWLIIK